MNPSFQDTIEVSTARLRATGLLPQIAVVLGTGWGPLAERVQGAIDIPYRDLPAFPVLGVGGHAGQVRLGQLGGRSVAVLAGRKHAYETGEPDGMKGAIRTLAALGVKVLVQTNASGSMEPAMRPGELMLVTDQAKLIRMNISDMRVIGRNSAGVRLFDVGKSEHVVGAARIEAEDEVVSEVGEAETPPPE